MNIVHDEYIEETGCNTGRLFLHGELSFSPVLRISVEELSRPACTCVLFDIYPYVLELSEVTTLWSRICRVFRPTRHDLTEEWKHGRPQDFFQEGGEQ